MISHPSTVTIRTREAYCSGVLVDVSLRPRLNHRTRLVLTCAHFFRPGLVPGDSYKVFGGFNRRIQAVRTIDGTDIAICALDRPAPPRDLPGLSESFPHFRQPVITWGFGGKAARAQRRRGHFLAPLWRTWSADLRTTVSPAGFLFNAEPALKGDSGGPAFVGEEVVGTQSLILDPFGANLHVATISLAAPHRAAIAAAASALLKSA